MKDVIILNGQVIYIYKQTYHPQTRFEDIKIKGYSNRWILTYMINKSKNIYKYDGRLIYIINHEKMFYYQETMDNPQHVYKIDKSDVKQMTQEEFVLEYFGQLLQL